MTIDELKGHNEFLTFLTALNGVTTYHNDDDITITVEQSDYLFECREELCDLLECNVISVVYEGQELVQ